MNSPAGAVAQLIENAGLGEIGKNIFLGDDLPQEPNSMIAVVDVGSEDPPLTSIELSTHLIQVVCRERRGNLRTAYNKMDDTNRHLHGLTQFDHGTYRYVFLFIKSGPSSLSHDIMMRTMYTTDYRIMRTPIPGVAIIGADLESGGDGEAEPDLTIEAGGE